MRILHYTGIYAPAWSYGGPPRSVANLCEGLAGLGHEVSVFTTNAGLEQDPAIATDRMVERNGVKVRYFPAHFDRMGLRSPELEAAVHAEAAHFDLIHVTGVWQPTSVAACRAARRARKPYVCSPRGALGRYSFTQKPWKKWPYYWLWERGNLAGAAALHCTSGMELEEYRRLGLRPPGFVVPNSIDLAAWRRNESAGRSWRQASGITPEEYVLLYAGRLHHKKGLDLLAAACRQLPADQAWRLVLVGVDEDGSGAVLQREFASAGLGSRLILQSGTDTTTLGAAYSGADTLVFPSRHENFGNVAVEALACGCPVLLSDQVGVADQLADLPGVAVLPREAGAWAQTLAAWMIRRDRSGRETGATAVAVRFAPAALAARMVQAYDKLDLT